MEQVEGNSPSLGGEEKIFSTMGGQLVMAVYVAVYVAVVAAVWAGVIMIIVPSSGGGGGRDAIVLGREKMTCKNSSERAREAREKGSHEGRIRNEKETARGGESTIWGKNGFQGAGLQYGWHS